jgi:hypothetical protein
MPIRCSGAAAAPALLAEIAPRRGNDQCAEAAGGVGPCKCKFFSHCQNGTESSSTSAWGFVVAFIAPCPI